MIADSADQYLKTENKVAIKNKNLIGSLMKVSASHKAIMKSWNGEGRTDYIPTT